MQLLSDIDRTSINSSFSGMHPSLGVEMIDHFVSGGSSANAGCLGWISSVSSGTIGAGTRTDGTHIGTCVIGTGTVASGSSAISLGNAAACCLGLSTSYVFETLVQVPNLSTSTDEYTLRFGLHTALNSTAPGNGVYFEYARATSGDFWRAVSTKSSTPIAVVTTSAITASTWYKLKIVVNAAGTIVTYYVNDVLVATINTTANIPTGTSLPVNPCFLVFKSAGTTARNAIIDWFYLKAVYGI